MDYSVKVAYCRMFLGLEPMSLSLRGTVSVFSISVFFVVVVVPIADILRQEIFNRAENEVIVANFC